MTTISTTLTTRSNPRFTIQSSPANTGGRSSKSGTPWPATYSARWVSSSVVVGAIRTLTPQRCASLDEIEQLRFVEDRRR